jgi:hypothetical protein
LRRPAHDCDPGRKGEGSNKLDLELLHDITFKKTLCAAEQDRPDVAAARARLKAEQPLLGARRSVFIDETPVTARMVRHYGRCLRGKRLVGSVPHSHWKTLTYVAALRVDGLTANFVLDGAMNGTSFLAHPAGPGINQNRQFCVIGRHPQSAQGKHAKDRSTPVGTGRVKGRASDGDAGKGEGKAS